MEDYWFYFSPGNQLFVDLDATFVPETVLDIPKIVELFQEYLIDDYWLPDSDGVKKYKLDFGNTTVGGRFLEEKGNDYNWFSNPSYCFYFNVMFVYFCKAFDNGLLLRSWYFLSLELFDKNMMYNSIFRVW